MPDTRSLTERLADSLRARDQELAVEAAADHLALSQPSDPETIAMDEQSDRETEAMLVADAKGLERAKFTASALVELWIKAGPDARALALTALVHSLNISRNAKVLAHGTPRGESGPPEHLCTNLVLLCEFPGCFVNVSEVLPPRARTAIVNLSRRGPLDEADRLELAADRIVSTLMERAAVVDPESFNLGSLPSKLADLLRET